MQKSTVMNSFYAIEYLHAEFKHRSNGKCTSRLTAAKFSKILSNQRHDDIVKTIIPSTGNKMTNMIISYKTKIRALYTSIVVILFLN